MGIAMRTAWAILAALGVFALPGGRTEAAEIQVLSAGAVKAVVPDIAETFRQETGHAVRLTFDTVGSLRQRAVTEPADILILSDAAVDDLGRQGIIVVGTR